MNKLIIFDLDGVLIDSRDLHYRSLNAALSSYDPKFVIEREEHLSTFDGLDTYRKLDILTNTKGLISSAHELIWKRKQQETFRLIKEFKENQKLIAICQKLKEQNYQLKIKLI